MTAIPVIDVSGLASADPAARRATAAELGRACEEVGFLWVVGHGIPPEVVDGAFAAAHRFFALPLERKTFATLTEGVLNRGYQVPIATMRLLHYPVRPAGAPDGQFGAGAHTDWGAVTVLTQDGVGGLQVLELRTERVRNVELHREVIAHATRALEAHLAASAAAPVEVAGS